MSNILKIAGAGALAGEETDENFNQTVLLLHGDGTNGAQNNTFLDSSTNNFTVTRAGNTTQGTFSPFSAPDGRWSNYLGTTSERLTTSSSNAGFSFGTGDFTVEFFVNLNAQASQVFQMSTASTGYNASLSNTVSLYFGGGINLGKIEIYANNTQYVSTNVVMTSSLIGKWVHVAMVRSSGTTKVYCNGSEVTGLTSIADSVNYSMTYCVIGTSYDNSYLLNGYISNFRVLKGTALYSGSTYTVPTSPLTAISNTEFLICQSNRFVDNSSNAIGLTVSGSPKITPFSPFAPTAAYSASVNGGSGYFDGTGDYLSVADNAALELGNDDFTIEGWYYFANTGSSGTCFFGKWATIPSRSYALTYRKSVGAYTFLYSTDGSNETLVNSSAVSAAINQWVHIAAVRNGTSLKVYLNGAEIISHNISTTTIYNASNNFMIGRFEDNTNYDLAGYCSSFRFVKGTAVYTSAFTPSTSPLTEVSGTSLLTNFTNAGIFDNTGKNNLETVGGAQIDTTTKKYGTGSMEFDGTGDVLKLPLSPNLDFGTGDFTIECWAYITNLSPGYNPTLIARWQSGSSLYTMQIEDGGTFRFITAAGTWTGGSVSANTWTHLAVSRSGSNLRLFNQGVLESTNTDTTSLSSATQITSIGGEGDAAQSTPGFLDDVRITKGVARYTSAFTPPTKEFPNL